MKLIIQQDRRKTLTLLGHQTMQDKPEKESTSRKPDTGHHWDTQSYWTVKRTTLLYKDTKWTVYLSRGKTHH